MLVENEESQILTQSNASVSFACSSLRNTALGNISWVKGILGERPCLND